MKKDFLNKMFPKKFVYAMISVQGREKKWEIGSITATSFTQFLLKDLKAKKGL